MICWAGRGVQAQSRVRASCGSGRTREESGLPRQSALEGTRFPRKEKLTEVSHHFEQVVPLGEFAKSQASEGCKRHKAAAQGQEAKKSVEGKTGKIELSKHPVLSGEAPTMQTGGKGQQYKPSATPETRSHPWSGPPSPWPQAPWRSHDRGPC